jgi:hypothetical protein
VVFKYKQWHAVRHKLSMFTKNTKKY